MCLLRLCTGVGVNWCKRAFREQFLWPWPNKQRVSEGTSRVDEKRLEELTEVSVGGVWLVVHTVMGRRPNSWNTLLTVTSPQTWVCFFSPRFLQICLFISLSFVLERPGSQLALNKNRDDLNVKKKTDSSSTASCFLRLDWEQVSTFLFVF